MLVQRKYGIIELGAGLFVYNQCSANVPGVRLCVYAPVLRYVLRVGFSFRVVIRFRPNPGGLATFTVIPLVFCFRFLVREISVVFVPRLCPPVRLIVRVFTAYSFYLFELTKPFYLVLSFFKAFT